MARTQISLAVILLFVFLVSANAVLNLNVVSFGARNNGRTDSTQAFLKAWASACASRQPVMIYVPRGSYLLRQVIFKGPCRNSATNFKIDGTLVAPSYKVLNTANWIYFTHVTGLSITGGTLDGRGASFWACRKSGKGCPGGARNLQFNYGVNVVIKGLKTINSQVTHIVINNCRNLLMQALSVIAPANSPNTDGIHVQFSTGVTILGSSITTGDDCVSIGQGTRNLLIDRSSCGPGHGISIGSLGDDRVEQGVEGVTVKNVVFTGSDNGLRIKTWARPSNGFVRRILYQNIIMRNVKNPLIIDQHYCPGNKNCPRQQSGIKISDVRYMNIQGTSATPMAIKFDCSRTSPCKGLRLHAVRLTYQNRRAQSSCQNANGVSTGSVQPTSCLR